MYGWVWWVYGWVWWVHVWVWWVYAGGCMVGYGDCMVEYCGCMVGCGGFMMVGVWLGMVGVWLGLWVYGKHASKLILYYIIVLLAFIPMVCIADVFILSDTWGSISSVDKELKTWSGMLDTALSREFWYSW